MAAAGTPPVTGAATRESPGAAIAAMFGQLEGLHAAAVGRAAPERWYAVAGRRVRMVGAPGPLLDRLAPALSHLETEPSNDDADLTVLVWDLAGAGQTFPSSPLLPHPGAVLSPVLTSDRFLLTLFQSTLSCYDRERRLALYCVSDASLFPVYESAGPLRYILRWWAGGEGLHLVHSAAVGTSAGGVLLTGPGGSGKSTTALACLADGMLDAGDDYVLVEPDPPYVHGLYASAKLDWDHLARVPDLLPEPVNTPSSPEKACAFLSDPDGNRLSRGFPLRAVFLPTVTGGRATSVAPVTPARALRALAPATLLQLPGSSAGDLTALANLTAALPCFELRLGDDVSTVAPAVREVLAEAAA
jgi:hypothetical protein